MFALLTMIGVLVGPLTHIKLLPCPDSLRFPFESVLYVEKGTKQIVANGNELDAQEGIVQYCT